MSLDTLDQELRFHQAKELHLFVGDLLAGVPAEALRPRAAALETARYHLRITRSLETAKAYLRDRYQNDPRARFGMLASSRDKALERFGVKNDYQSTKRMRLGPWYGDSEDDYEGRSCRLLEDCVTEFGAQGLELDGALVAWGTDLVWTGEGWSNASARRYKAGVAVKDPLQLRLNAYRVLLTRGRDVAVLLLPQASSLDETYEHLRDSGFLELTDGGAFS